MDLYIGLLSCFTNRKLAKIRKKIKVKMKREKIYIANLITT